MKTAVYVPSIPDENTTPPLGPLYLLAVLQQNGFDTRLFDARIDKDAFSKLAAFKPDILGVSAVTPGYLGGLKAAGRIKNIFPSVPVVFGGAHPTSMADSVAAEPVVDYVVAGEGEATVLQLFTRLRDGGASTAALDEIKGLVYRKGDEIIRTPSAPLLESADLDRLPWPAFDRMDMDAYFGNTQTHGLFRRGKRILPIMSTRGCPESCTFCCRVMGRKIRSRSVESVIAEIEYLVRTYGVDEIYFEDDNFTTVRDRALQILDRIAAMDRRIFLKFANGIRADRVDRELLAAMKRAGVYSLSFGIESGCPATLEKMRKHLNLDKARENIFLAKSMGFLVGSNCILGYPGETSEDAGKSLDFFLSLPLDSMAIVNLVPFPGTEVRTLCETKGYLTKAAGNWDNYYFSLNNPIVLIETPTLPADELRRLVRRAYRRMYLRPSWIWRTLKHLSLRQIVHGAAVVVTGGSSGSAGLEKS